MEGCTAGYVPPVLQTDMVEDGGPDGPECAADSEPLQAGNEREENRRRSAEGAGECADNGSRDGWGVVRSV